MKRIIFPKDNIFKIKKYRLLFGRIIHLYIEKLVSNPKVAEKIYHDLDYLNKVVKNELFGGLTPNKNERKVIKYAWMHIRKSLKRNLIKFINNLRSEGFKPLIEFTFSDFEVSNKLGKIRIKRKARPDILLINHENKKIVIIEIKSGIKYESHKRQIKKYFKTLSKFYPNYEIRAYLYIENKDELKEFKS